eukprot:scaffold44736_cov62-Attheya_sp.AAC.3
MKEHGFPIKTAVPKIHCRVFKDTSGALEIAKTHKYRPRTKHINIKLHHFRDYVNQKEVSIHPINTLKQLADYLVKPVNQETLVRLRARVKWDGKNNIMKYHQIIMRGSVVIFNMSS